MPTVLAERPDAAERALGDRRPATSRGSRRRGRGGWKHASRPAPNRPGFASGPRAASALVSVGGYDPTGRERRRGVVFTTKRYYQLAGVTVAVRDSAGGGSLNYLLGDQLGSTTMSVNASTGATSTQRFLPYCAPRSGSIGATDRGWIGQTKDASTGLQYLNARYYDPTVGRFTATDPLASLSEPGSLDAFGYGRGSPVTLSDPTGLDPDTSAIYREDARRRGGCTMSCPGGETSTPPPLIGPPAPTNTCQAGVVSDSCYGSGAAKPPGCPTSACIGRPTWNDPNYVPPFFGWWSQIATSLRPFQAPRLRAGHMLLFSIRSAPGAGAWRSATLEATAYIEGVGEASFSHTCLSDCDVIFAFGSRDHDAAHGILANGPGVGDGTAQWDAGVAITEAVASKSNPISGYAPIHEARARVDIYSNWVDPGLSSFAEPNQSVPTIIVYVEPSG